MTDLTPMLDHDIATALASAPPLDLSDLETARRKRLERVSGSDLEIEPGTVTMSDLRVPADRGGPEVMVRVYGPPDGNGALHPAMVWIHGGGHVLGHARQDGVLLASIVASTGCRIFSVDPRLAPEHPFPAEVDDAYAALRWIHGSAAQLGVDPERLIVGGASSGGGTAAAIALLARDRGEVPLAHQVLVYPMLDDRGRGSSSRAITDPRVWDVDKNAFAWRSYLGRSFGTDAVSPYAAPSRAVDLGGLPSASIFIGDRDLFLDECLEYAARLIAAGVSTGLRVYPRSPHGFDSIAPHSRPARTYRADLLATLHEIVGAGR